MAAILSWRLSTVLWLFRKMLCSVSGGCWRLGAQSALCLGFGSKQASKQASKLKPAPVAEAMK